MTSPWHLWLGRRCLATSVVLLIAFQARAETELSFYLGAQGAAPGRLHSVVLGDTDVDWETLPFNLPPHYGARATWWRPNGTGFGVEFNHAKVKAKDPGALGYDRLEFTHGLNLLTANLWVRLTPVGRVQPYAGFGLGVSVPHVDIRPVGQAHTYGYQLAGPAAQWTLGAAVPLNDQWSVFGEYKGTFSSNHVKLDSGGTIDTDIRTDAFNFGLSLHF